MFGRNTAQIEVLESRLVSLETELIKLGKSINGLAEEPKNCMLSRQIGWFSAP